MSCVWRVSAVLAMGMVLAPAVFADDLARAKDAARKEESASANTGSANAAPAARRAAKGTARTAAARAPQKTSAPAAKKSRSTATERATPALAPIPATSGTLGLFTVETGQTLPTKGVSFSAYANKFSRMPGSVTVLNVGWNFGVGIRDWLTFFAGWEPLRHTHIGNASQLSLRTSPFDPINNPPFPNSVNPTMYRRLGAGLLPGYVEDYPFAANNDGGVGELILGFKLGLLSEQRGHPISMAVRNDFIFPTRTTLRDLLENGTQSGQFNYAVTLALSHTFSNVATLTGNLGWRFTRDPRVNSLHTMAQADQGRIGAGILLFPESRIQVMTEYTGVVYSGTHTPNTSFGARDPVDGVWGVRLYPWKNVALDFGYLYMLNLKDANDRHGFVVKVGSAMIPSKVRPNNPPVASCSADKTSVYTGSGDTVVARVAASDPDGDPLTYTWTATGGRVDGTGAEVRWSSAGLASGLYTITAHVDDGRGGTASCSVDVRVEPRPNRPPTMSCSVDRSSVLAGERVRLTGVASDPDGDPLTYSWRASAGQIVGSGESVQFDTTGLAPGHYTITGRVEDGRGGAADCSTDVDVQAPPPPPQASKINECEFKTARVDNVCKRILDDVSLRLKNEPRATVVIVGYADPKEPKPDVLAKLRGENAAKFLTEKGIDRGRINVRSATGQKGASNNRRIDVIWVPEGATY